MSRAWSWGLLILFVAASAGCTACGTPFDYCSATYNPYCNPCDDCRENVRLGSIFSDDSIAPMSYSEPVKQPTPADRPETPAEDLPVPDEEESTIPDLTPPEGTPPVDEMPLEEPGTSPSDEAPDEALPPLTEPSLEPAETPRSSSSRAPRMLRR